MDFRTQTSLTSPEQRSGFSALFSQGGQILQFLVYPVGRRNESSTHGMWQLSPLPRASQRYPFVA
ncbi:hypothetical protein AXZ77_0736 [Thioclava sp. ES.031]|nr:hypothetical protein AXZ77_0736 [Thioclava sp. ES.031]